MSNTKKIAVLLNGPVKNDYRVIKVISSLSKSFDVSLFYIDGQNDDSRIFNERVKLNSYIKSTTFFDKIIQNTLFFYEYYFMVKKVLNNSLTYDYIIANDLPTLLPAYKIAKKQHAKLIYDSHEIYIETIPQFFPKNTSFFKSLIFKLCIFIMKHSGKFIEKKILKSTHCLITVNESIKKYFNSIYQIKRSEVLMNLPFLNNQSTVTKKIDFKKEFGWKNDDKVFLYQGVLNEGRGLRMLIESMQKAPKNAKLVILGDGFIKPELIKLVEEQQLTEKVQFKNKVPLNNLPSYTVAADFGVNLLEDTNLSKKLASPNKLFEYIHAQIPVLCSKSPENDKVLSEFNIGVSTQNTVDEISNSMATLIDSEPSVFTENCKKAAQKYNWEIQESVLYNVFK